MSAKVLCAQRHYNCDVRLRYTVITFHLYQPITAYLPHRRLVLIYCYSGQTLKELSFFEI